MAEIPPTREEIEQNRFLDALDAEAEALKRETIKNWEENVRQVRGDQWKIRRAPYFLANILKNQVRRNVATLTEVKPQIQIMSLKPELTKTSESLYNSCKAIWDRSSTYENIYRLCWYTETFGSGFIGTYYDPLIDDIVIANIDPRRVFIDPGVTSGPDIGKGSYLRIDSVLSLNDIRRRFPGRGMLVKPDESYSTFALGTRQASALGTAMSWMPRVYRRFATAQSSPIPKSVLKEYWIKDPQINTEANLLFPGGRHVIRAGNVILLDEPNPYWDGEWPLDCLEWDIDFESPWGLDGVQDMRRIQESINRMGDAWVRNYILGSNFKVIADLDALDPEQWEKLDNEAGLIVRKKPSRSFEYQPAIPPSDQLPQTIQGFIALMELMAGNMDPGGGGAASQSGALEGLQMARQSIIRAVSRRLESVLERVGQKLISRIFQFYTADRVLAQQGADNKWVSYILSRQTLLTTDQGVMRPIEDRQRMYRDFKFLVTPGSSLATTRVQRTMAALQLRAATGIAPSIRRIMQEADLGDPDQLIQEGLDEAKRLPPPPPPKGRGGRS